MTRKQQIAHEMNVDRATKIAAVINASEWFAKNGDGREWDAYDVICVAIARYEEHVKDQYQPLASPAITADSAAVVDRTAGQCQ